MSECPCWRFEYRLGHPGHCCFLADERPAEGMTGDTEWRDPPCHIPADLRSEGHPGEVVGEAAG